MNGDELRSMKRLEARLDDVTRAQVDLLRTVSEQLESHSIRITALYGLAGTADARLMKLEQE